MQSNEFQFFSLFKSDAGETEPNKCKEFLDAFNKDITNINSISMHRP